MPTITSGRDASTARAASAITSNVGSPTGLACTCMPAVARATAGMPATGSSTTTRTRRPATTTPSSDTTPSPKLTRTGSAA